MKTLKTFARENNATEVNIYHRRKTATLKGLCK